MNLEPDLRDSSEGASTALRLSVRGLSKQYGAVRALSDVDFELRPGEVMALLGENGAGKSTLVKTLTGLVRPDSGEIEIDGVAADLSSGTRARAAGIAVVQQEFSLIGCRTVAQNLALGRPGAPAAWTPRRLRQQAVPLLDAVGLSHVDPATPVEQLTVAEMQLIELARVLADDARIVIFDEPTAALNDAEIRRVLEVVRRLADNGQSVIYVTHRLPEVFEIADRVTVVRNGRASAPRPLAGLTSDHIIEMMLGRKLSSMYPKRSGSFGDVSVQVTDLLVPTLRSPVSFEVRAGEILGLAGQIGSGAANIARGLAGVVPATAGVVRIRGRELALGRRAAGIKAGVAFCSSDRKRDGIFADISVRYNMSAPWLRAISRGGWLSRSKELRRVKADSAAFAIDGSRIDALVGNLSGGNQQKVALGKWLGVDPAVLIVEEPTRGVDVGARAEIYQRINALCEAGMAVIVASSDTSEVLGICDRVAAFYKGELTGIYRTEELTEERLVKAVMQAEEVPA